MNMGNTSDLRTDNGVAIKAGAGSDAGNSSTPSNNDVVSVIVPVYRIENASFELYLDIDSLEQVFFRMKEEGR